MATEQTQTKDQQNRQDRNQQQDRTRQPATSEQGLARMEGGARQLMPFLPFASPLTVMRRFIEGLDQLSEGGSLEARPAIGLPPVEINEHDGKVVIDVDLPGMTKEQIEVQVQDGQLIISGERRQEVEQRDRGFYRSERIYGSFTRAIPLPDGAKVEEAKATFANGVLEITVPAPPRSKGRLIDIQDAPEAKQAH
jgi:HSP20 family protein